MNALNVIQLIDEMNHAKEAKKIAFGIINSLTGLRKKNGCVLLGGVEHTSAYMCFADGCCFICVNVKDMKQHIPRKLWDPTDKRRSLIVCLPYGNLGNRRFMLIWKDSFIINFYLFFEWKNLFIWTNDFVNFEKKPCVLKHLYASYCSRAMPYYKKIYM